MTIPCSSLRRPFSDPGLSLVLFILLAWLAGCSSASTKRTVPEGTAAPGFAAASAPGLAVGIPIEREIAPGETHRHPLDLQAGWYLALRVDQFGSDVVASLIGPDGTPLLSVDDPGGLARPERISWVTVAAGTYQLTIAPISQQAVTGTSRYRLKLEELRPQSAQDGDRVAAERLLAEGRTLAHKAEERGEDEAKVKARAAIEKALDYWRTIGDPAGQVRALIALGGIDSAEARVLEALDLAKRSGDLEGEAEAYEALGDLRAEQAAVEAYEGSHRAWQRLGHAGGQGRNLLWKALKLLLMNQPEKAFGPAQEALSLLREVGDINNQATALTVLQGSVLKTGNVEQAYRYLEQALSLRPLHPAIEAQVHYNLGNIYKHRGELQKALESLERARKINHDLERRTGELFCVYGIGSVYHDLGDLDKALEHYNEALELGKDVADPGFEAGLRNNIGWVLYRQGHGDQALESYSQALKISRDNNLSSNVASALHNIGTTKVALNRMQEGLEALLEALDLRKDKDLYPWAQTLRETGTAYQRLGDAEQAAKHYEESLAIGRRIGSPNLVAEGLYRWALLDRERGRSSESLARIREAIELVESVRSQVSVDDLRNSFFASKRVYYELYVALLMELHEREPGGAYLRQALAASENARSRGLLDLLFQGRIDVHEGIDPSLRQRETELSSTLSWLLTEARGSSPAVGILEQVSRVEQDLTQLQTEVRQRYPQYAGVRYPKALELKGIRDLLREGEALLEYFVGDEGSFLFVVTRDALQAYTLPPRKEISAAVKEIRTLLEQPSDLEIAQFRRQSRRLYQMLLEPAKSMLGGKRLLLIAPDGPLYFLPFEILLTDGRKSQGEPYSRLPYLLLDQAIAYVPSASVLDELRTGTEQSAPESWQKGFVAFADPDLAGEAAPVSSLELRGAARPDRSSLGRLPYSKQEVEAIARLFKADEVELYLERNATKKNVLGNPLVANAQRVHFATHGYVDEVRPELSALVLTSAAGQDGDLTVSEIFNMKLKADLLVLSACDTGRGEEVRGEGVVGLTRAFLYAGAKSLVVSLWPVVDRPTARFMEQFYQTLKTTASKAEALRTAKLQMIQSGQANPYFWAPFILSGNPGSPNAGM